MMGRLKKRKIDEIIVREGGAKYTNDPNDSGKGTRFGITESVARDNGYTGHMRDLPRSFAFEIYATEYWDRVWADDLVQISERVAEEVVDTAVNTGSVQAGEFLQQSLNVLNRAERLYADIAVDGSIGPATISALDSYVTHRSDDVLLKALNCLQGAFYIGLATRREKDERFVYGWLKNRVVI
jgi:lysozyme family protein